MCKKLDGPNFEQLTVPDLVQLEKQLNAKISQIRARKGAFHDQENHAYVLVKLQPSDILHLGLGSPYRNDDGIQNDPPKYGKDAERRKHTSEKRGKIFNLRKTYLIHEKRVLLVNFGYQIAALEKQGNDTAARVMATLHLLRQ
ncbi:hypothetical protein Pint_23749 [Pistacia integerrima]|uniref:Uncharacterized protein n=1 Tax=Pistacia integerrima TaxID=434235 RepID=A0ACC0YKF8_9ROSI|nr:hypothetical protein Pint_23749 [Pistacia integerrima]